MRVEIGPVASESADAWIAYGRHVLDHLTAAGLVSSGTVERFVGLLDEFDAVAASPTESGGWAFHWVGDTSPEEVEFLMKGLYEVGLVVEREHELGRLPLRPAEADEFHIMVVQQILAAIEVEGPAFAQFVEGLRSEWGVAGQ